MIINPAIFKAYDVRGRVPKELNVDTARKIGNAITAFLSKKYKKRNLTLYIGSDVRTSSPALKKALIEGITLHGSTAVDIGTVTTPLFYFALAHSKNDGGVMVTASHNPPDYNGFKIRGRNSDPISEATGLKTIQKIASKKDIYPVPSRMPRGLAKRMNESINPTHKDQHPVGRYGICRANKIGEIRSESGWAEKYISFLVRRAKIDRARVVIDAASGSATLILPKLLSHFPNLLYKPLFFTPDGTFSIHNPNPLLKESQGFIKENLSSGGFGFGVLFDGDGDRIVFFDEFGNEIRGDFIVALLAEEFLKRHPKNYVAVNVTASKAVEEHIIASGGKPLRTKMGYVYISPAMKKVRAIVGGETSDHFYFRDFDYSESSMYALLKMLEIVSKTPKKLSHLVKPLQKYTTAPEANFSVKNKTKVINAVLKKFGQGGKISRLDGITIEFSNWWFNLRPSNTEPLVRLTIEAKTKELFDEKLKMLSGFIDRF